MAAINFPPSPAHATVHIENGETFIYSATYGGWLCVSRYVPQGNIASLAYLIAQGSYQFKDGTTFFKNDGDTANTIGFGNDWNSCSVFGKSSASSDPGWRVTVNTASYGAQAYLELRPDGIVGGYSSSHGGGFTLWGSHNDGAGSTLDADLLDGQDGSYYRDATNLNAGTLHKDRFANRQQTTPAPTAGSGTLTSAAAEVNYQELGDGTVWDATVTITANGTAAGFIVVPMPFTAAKECVSAGRQAAVGGGMCQGLMAAGSANLVILKYDNTYPGGDGERITLSGRTFV